MKEVDIVDVLNEVESTPEYQAFSHTLITNLKIILKDCVVGNNGEIIYIELSPKLHPVE